MSRKRAQAAGLAIEVRRMGESTRTAEEAAQQMRLPRLRRSSNSLNLPGQGQPARLVLFLVAGNNRLDTTKAAALAGEELERRGFRGSSATARALPLAAWLRSAISSQSAAFADETLLGYRYRLGCGGAHDAVFAATA